ncbi:MAG: hypothetical protein FWE93_00925 [Alphaproteobacteria bacterium]|nr:hypothetical protein [Alphaproteobacteria bacterium]
MLMTMQKRLDNLSEETFDAIYKLALSSRSGYHYSNHSMAKWISYLENALMIDNTELGKELATRIAHEDKSIADISKIWLQKEDITNKRLNNYAESCNIEENAEIISSMLTAIQKPRRLQCWEHASKLFVQARKRKEGKLISILYNARPESVALRIETNEAFGISQTDPEFKNVDIYVLDGTQNTNETFSHVNGYETEKLLEAGERDLQKTVVILNFLLQGMYKKYSNNLNNNPKTITDYAIARNPALNMSHARDVFEGFFKSATEINSENKVFEQIAYIANTHKHFDSHIKTKYPEAYVFIKRPMDFFRGQILEVPRYQ